VTPEERSRFRQLLTGPRVLAPAVVVDGEPVAGLVPYAVTSDFSALVVQASKLARHSQGLKAGGRWSGVLHEAPGPEEDPLQVARLTLEGVVHPVHQADAGYQAVAGAFLARVPGASQTLALGDFGLFRLELGGGRLILGFGRALNLSRAHFTDLAAA
jgi:hypothetical protein